MSRFDLLFIVLDLVDVEQDRRIADHVVRMHRYRASHEQDGDPLPLAMNLDMLSTNNPDENEATVQDTPLYEKYDALLHGSSRSKTDKIVSMQFMKKYIHVARALKVSFSLLKSTAVRVLMVFLHFTCFVDSSRRCRKRQLTPLPKNIRVSGLTKLKTRT